VASEQPADRVAAERAAGGSGEHRLCGCAIAFE